MPKPKTLSQLRSMTTAISSMSIFIPNAQRLNAPFNYLIGKGTSFKWTEELETNWMNIRKAVANAVTLNYHNTGEQLIIRSDASQIGWGGVLLVKRNNIELPVVFVSRTWKGAEGKYSAVWREATRLLRVVERLQPFMKGELNVIYETDSSAVSKILNHQGNDYLTKIAIYLSELGITTEQLRHIPGISNSIADWASRVPAPNINTELVYATTETTNRTSGVITYKDQLQDKNLVQIYETCKILQKAEYEEQNTEFPSRIRVVFQRFKIVSNILYRIEYPTETDPDSSGRLVIVVPSHLENYILKFVHENYGHPKGSRFIATLRTRYWFSNMINKATEFTSKCHTCQLSMTHKKINVGKGYREPAGIGMHIYIDHGYVGGTSESPEKQFLVMVDQASGFIAAAPVENRTVNSTISAIHEYWIRPYGPPEEITADGAKEFNAESLKSYLEKYKINLIHSSPYNPQANIAETAVKKIKTGLRLSLIETQSNILKRTSWTNLLDDVIFNWNMTYSDAIKAIPAQVFFGRTLKHPIDRISNQNSHINNIPCTLLKERLLTDRQEQYERKQIYFDRTEQRLVFPTGSHVLRCHQRIGPLGKDVVRVSGPYIIRGRISNTAYQLAHLDGTMLEDKIHHRWLQPYNPPDDGIPNTTQASISINNTKASIIGNDNEEVKALVGLCSKCNLIND